MRRTCLEAWEWVCIHLSKFWNRRAKAARERIRCLSTRLANERRQK